MTFGTAADDIVTLGTDLGESPRLRLNFGTRHGLPLLVDSILGIILVIALGIVVILGNELGESPKLGMSLSPSQLLSSLSVLLIHLRVVVLFLLKSYRRL